MRKQYHFRFSEKGLLSWDVDRLIMLTKNSPRKWISLKAINEFDDVYWYGLGKSEGDGPPTCRNIAEHALLIKEADLNYPIILSSNGGVMDGMHRVCKAYMEGKNAIEAVQFIEDPEPNYIGKKPGDLSY
ncbi:MAG: hypothetical protein GXP19_09930 [Gammaproteobacteria bacterium]|nr:hypothetical protein [Gammaproteobacteria bacterium]